MKKSGRTPLLRARQIEKVLDVGEIYIKLEGSNPTGHKYDRVGEIVIRDAIARGYDCVLVNGSVNYIKSLLYFATLSEVKILVPQFKNEMWKVKHFKLEMLMALKNHMRKDQLVILKEIALESHYYLAVEGHMKTQLSKTALEEISEEIVNRLEHNVTTIYTQLNYGYTFTSIYSVLLKHWIDGKFVQIPNIVCGTPKIGEAYIEDEANSKELSKWDPVDEKLLADLKKSVWETNGKLIAIEVDELNESVKLLRRLEHLKVTTNEAYAFAAFYRQAKLGEVQKGRHVIILNEGRSDVKIENINDFEEVSKKELVEYTRQWLAQYSDSSLETEDAIQNASERGFILLASRNGEYEGICIVVNLGFKDFIPTYHLAYIGTQKGSKGRGVGTELIQRALDLTSENLSLHVDLDNKGAKKLYEKLGFKHKYNRMIFHKE
ncbi:pyridoxal-phosphate dependent enzyme [Fusibacter sp. 3D3]|uniref:pyridoxal-phosphate dependent enzyme n=1 Tax=Fusibacter sp. 3D3 TaxID=1048380 RepID=UPI000853D05D|nr:pyridoxal-phosphate dependent enzyme [Fusibacter sp. 3D3]GAU77321.1 probable threonine synthase [Fusibacter sp. 3D3]